MNLIEAKQILRNAGYTLIKENSQVNEGFGSFLKKIGTTAALIGALAGAGSSAMAHPATTGEAPTKHSQTHWDISPQKISNKISNKMTARDARNVAENIRDIAKTAQGDSDSNGWKTFDGGKARVEGNGHAFTVIFDDGNAARYMEQEKSNQTGVLFVQGADGSKATYQVKEFSAGHTFDLQTGQMTEI